MCEMFGLLLVSISSSAVRCQIVLCVTNTVIVYFPHIDTETHTHTQSLSPLPPPSPRSENEQHKLCTTPTAQHFTRLTGTSIYIYISGNYATFQQRKQTTKTFAANYRTLLFGKMARVLQHSAGMITPTPTPPPLPSGKLSSKQCKVTRQEGHSLPSCQSHQQLQPIRM